MEDNLPSKLHQQTAQTIAKRMAFYFAGKKIQTIKSPFFTKIQTFKSPFFTKIQTIKSSFFTKIQTFNFEFL